jgi:hypothetical protein
VSKKHLDGHEAPAHGAPLEEGLELVASLADFHALLAQRFLDIVHPSAPSLLPALIHVMNELPDVQAPAAPPAIVPLCNHPRFSQHGEPLQRTVPNDL